MTRTAIRSDNGNVLYIYYKSSGIFIARCNNGRSFIGKYNGTSRSCDDCDINNEYDNCELVRADGNESGVLTTPCKHPPLNKLHETDDVLKSIACLFLSSYLKYNDHEQEIEVL